jgi:steroid 5-alpha reductase family enzyme
VTTGFARHAFVDSLPWSAVAIIAVLLVTYLASRIAHKHSVIDTAWGLLFCAAALAAFIGSSDRGDTGRRWLLLVLVLVWGLRLAVHIGRRSIGKGEDPRYEEMLADLGVAIWLLGLFFEAVGDWQMEQFKAQKIAGKLPKGALMDRGLWRYTRHPNYFGDACVWTGIFLVCLERWPGILTLFSPVIMIYLLAFGSGKRVLERSMAKRPGYREYMARTSGFIPMPPRRQDSAATH